MWRFQRFCSKPLNPNEVPLYGVAVTKKTLLDDEKFEIQVEQFVEPWSGSVRLGNLYFLFYNCITRPFKYPKLNATNKLNISSKTIKKDLSV